MDIREMISGKPNVLRNIVRYSREPIIKGENVGEHSYYVGLYSWIVANDLISRGHKIDIQKVMEGALLHDIEETVFGDLPRPIKKAYPEIDALVSKEAYSAVKKQIFDKIGVYDSEYPAKIWKNAMDDSLEGRIVRFADDLDVFAYAYEESRRGNKRMAELFVEHLEYIKYAHDNPYLADYAKQLQDIAEEVKSGMKYKAK